MELIFLGLAAVSLISGVLVVFQIHPLRSALWLIVNFFGVAGIYLLLHAEFIAAIQIIVYAGAIMVLFLFVIMLLNLREPEAPTKRPYSAQKLGGIVVSLAAAFFIAYGLSRVHLTPGSPMAAPGMGNTESIARLLFTDYLLPFEVTSVLLLVSIVGAVVLSKKKLQ